MEIELSMRSQQIVGDSGLQNDPVRGIIWLDIAMQIIPALLNMPCMKEKTPEQQRKHMERHPNLTRNQAARRARQANRNITKEESFRLADAAVESFLNSTEDEVAAFCEAIGPAK